MNKTLLRAVVSFTAIFLLASCSGSSSGGDDGGSTINVTPTVLDYSDATQEVLPVMQEAVTSISTLLSKASYAPMAYWDDTEVFSGMATKALSLDSSVGVESVFFLVSQIQMIVSSLGEGGAFNIVESECQFPPMEGIVGTAVAIGGDDSLSIPFIVSSFDNNYDCLITITDTPDEGEMSIVESMSYAFGIDLDNSGNAYMRYLAISMTRLQEGIEERDVMIIDYDQVNQFMRVDYAIYADKDSPFGMRALYEGDPAAHSFIFRTTMRGPLTQCTPEATDADDEAKKLASQGVSQGDDSRFAMKLQRVCDQESLGYSTDPQYFCLDGATKTPLADGSSCDDYADVLEGVVLLDASSVPFSNDDFDNGNLIVIETNSWHIVGDDYVSSGDTHASSFYIDENTDYYITSGDSTIIVPNVNVIYVAYQAANNKAHVKRYAPTDANGNYSWEELGELNDELGSPVDVTVLPQEYVTTSGERNGVPYIAYHKVSPSVPSVIVKKYENGQWVDATDQPPMAGNYARNVIIRETNGHIFVSWAIASATGPVYVSWLPLGASSWTMVGGGTSSVGTVTSYLYGMDAFYDANWTDNEYNTSVIAVLYQSGSGIHIYESKCNTETVTCLGWNEHYTFELIPVTSSTVQSLSVDMPDAFWGWLIAYTLDEPRTGEYWMNVARVANGVWTYLDRTGLPSGNVEDVKTSYDGGITAIAYTDIENTIVRGSLVTQQYRMGEWQAPGGAQINDYGTKVDDFHVYGGVPYILYKVRNINRLRLMRYSTN